MEKYTQNRIRGIWNNYSNIHTEIEHINNMIKQKAINSATKETITAFNDITNLIQQKQDLLKRYTKYTENFKNLDKKQQNIANLYYTKKQPTTDICEQLHISKRTLYRYLKQINKRISL